MHRCAFIDSIVAPLWRTAALLLPGAKARIEVLEANRTAWLRAREGGDCTAEEQSAETASRDAQHRADSADGEPVVPPSLFDPGEISDDFDHLSSFHLDHSFMQRFYSYTNVFWINH